MNDTLDELQRKAEAALEPDWFDPDLIDSDAPIRSTRTARAYIACASPDVMLRLIAVAKNAQEVMAVYSEELDFSDDEETEALQSNARRCEAAWLGLQSSLAALEAGGTREEGTR